MSWLVVRADPEVPDVYYVRPDLIVAVRVRPCTTAHGYSRFIAELRTGQGGTFFGAPYMGEHEAMLEAGEFMAAIDAYAREVER